MLPIPNHPQGTRIVRLLTDEDPAIRSQGVALADALGLSAEPLVVLVGRLNDEDLPIGRRLSYGPLREEGSYLDARPDAFTWALERLHYLLEDRPWITRIPGEVGGLCRWRTEHEARRAVGWLHHFLGRWDEL
jgi:hypothetical protein